MGRRALIGVALLAGACSVRRPQATAPALDAGPPAAASAPSIAPPNKDKDKEQQQQIEKDETLAHPFLPCPVPDKQDLDAALDEAARRFDRQEYKVSLACAEQAARIAPRSVEAQHDRAEALVALERLDDARDAFAFALALDPDDPQTLASAADLYVNQLGPGHDLVLIGLEYARRGSAHVGRRRQDRELSARLALLEAEALDDLGRADEALPRVEAALRNVPESTEARYQRALVYFHLCKLDKARDGFEDVLRRSPDDAYAHHHLGLLLERQGSMVAAESHFSRARAIAPAQFPAPVVPSRAEFEAMVARAVAALDPATKSLAQAVRLEIVDLPEMEDLVAVEPPFPPTILGLYRGGDPGEEKSIVFYRMNLGRAAATLEELEKQVKVTLLHEIGHMAGADEDELRERGFE